MLAEFFDWWTARLLELVPARLAQGSGAGADALIVDASAPGVLTLQRRRRGVETRVAQLRLDDTGLPSLRAALNARPRGEPVWLRVPPDTVLERPVNLPLAAERDPERVLGYDMERLTPFTADEVFWGFSIEERDRARGRLGVRLTLVPRAAVSDLIEQLIAAGGRPSLLEAATVQGLRAIKLHHADSGAGASRLSFRVALAAVGVLALLVLVSPFLKQSLALSEAQDRLDGLASPIRLVNGLRDRILGAGAGGDAALAEARRVGDTLLALSVVTDVLPDDAYLSEFTMRERKMTLSGLAASAPKLITVLSEDPHIRSPAFTAPVTRSEASKSDVFSIRAEFLP